MRRSSAQGTRPILNGLGNGFGVVWDDATGKLFYSSSTDILRANADGSGSEVLIAGHKGFSLCIDAVHGRLYWTEADSIYRANMDGSNVEAVVWGLDYTYGVTLDPAADRH